jgi:hypothetical protein
MELARYEAVPPPVQQQLATAHAGRRKVEDED